VNAPLGKECRELFTVPDGWSIVGADMSGLELRCLAHYLAPMDGGAYAKVVCEGDVHTHNQQAAGLETRAQAKTFIYAWLYGAGPGKIGKIVGGSAAKGHTLIDRFLEALPAVKGLKKKVSHNVRVAGHLKGLDGRLLPIRSNHAALNTLLQSAGAVLCKQWVCDSYGRIEGRGFVYGEDFTFLGWIHDELQIAVRAGMEKEVGAIVTECARRAGEPFGFRVPLASDFHTGKNWSETHG
jgi:DNA polymerase I-like protein with 3'-5' exonuclease and polymerase domains